MRIRTAASPDADAITRLINLAFQVERFFIDDDRIGIQEVQQRLGTGRFLLAEDGDGLAGCAYVELQGERAYLGLLSVDPARQNTGIGKQLVFAAEEHARNAGCRFMDLRIVNLRRELPGFYARLGYIEDGTSPFPEHARPKQPCHFVNMSKALA